MNLKECGYEIEIECWKVKEFEERILFSGLCDFIIPMSFSNISSVKRIKYNCSGYTSVRDMGIRGPREAFEIIEKTFKTLSKSIEFYIPYEKISLNIDTVFYNMKQKNVRIAYIPADTGTLIDHLNEFLDDMMKIAEQDTEEYILSLKEDLNSRNRNLKDMTIIVSEQRKRINQCGI